MHTNDDDDDDQCDRLNYIQSIRSFIIIISVWPMGETISITWNDINITYLDKMYDRWLTNKENILI